jgi:hypothetical protein
MGGSQRKGARISRSSGGKFERPPYLYDKNGNEGGLTLQEELYILHVRRE